MAENHKNLVFLESLMKLVGIDTLTELAERLECSKQNISNYFKKDDMKFSMALEIAEKLGYELNFSIVPRRKPRKQDLMNPESINRDKLANPPKEELEERLGFLRYAVKYSGLDKKTLAGELGVSTATFNRWFDADKGTDILVSYIFQIAQLIDCVVVVKCNKISLK